MEGETDGQAGTRRAGILLSFLLCPIQVKLRFESGKVGVKAENPIPSAIKAAGAKTSRPQQISLYGEAAMTTQRAVVTTFGYVVLGATILAIAGSLLNLL